MGVSLCASFKRQFLSSRSKNLAQRLQALRVAPEVLEAWRELVAQEIKPMDEEDEF